jgi:hypothetical protein
MLCIPCEMRRATFRIKAMRLLRYDPFDIAEKLTSIYQADYRVVLQEREAHDKVFMFYRYENGCVHFVTSIG